MSFFKSKDLDFKNSFTIFQHINMVLKYTKPEFNSNYYQKINYLTSNHFLILVF